MADNPFESMLPYQQTSAYKTRVLEVARLMMEHQCGITLPQVTNKMRQIMEINIKQLFEERNSPDLVGSKLLYLSTWRECLKLYNPGKSEFPRLLPSLGAAYQFFLSPDGVPNFPLAEELESELTDQSVCLRAPSTEYKAYHGRQILEERQRAANQEWQVIKSKVVEHLLPPVATQLPGTTPHSPPPTNMAHPQLLHLRP